MSLRHAIRGGRARRCLVAVGLLLGATTLTAGMGTVTSAATPGDAYASSSGGSIHPGIEMTSPQGQCTANFIFTADHKVLIGQAAHCTGKGSDSETNGCRARSAPLGTLVKIRGASQRGKLVYSSWLTMQKRGDKNKDLCAYNDFALVEIDSADVDKVDPTVPVFGGPTGLRSGSLANGASVYSYQNSSLRQGLTQTSAKNGISLGDSGGGREHQVATLTPGVPGDSGSGFMDADGRAFGVLSTLNLDPAPGTNGVADLAKALSYANQYGGLGDIQLERGHRSFNAGSAGPLPGL